jgi:hypothetical protein
MVEKAGKFTPRRLEQILSGNIKQLEVNGNYQKFNTKSQHHCSERPVIFLAIGAKNSITL